MKKFMLMAVVALMAAISVNAQNEEGGWTIMPKVGMNLATWAGDPDAKWLSGYMGGFEVEFGATENIGLVAGLHYSLQGEKDDVNKTKFMFGYTNVPLLVQFYPVKGLAIKAGVQLGFAASKKYTKDGVRYDIDYLKAIGVLPSDYNFRKFDLDIPMGISYEYQNIVLDARYNLGLINIVTGNDLSCRNSVFQFSLGYKIPFTR